MFQFKQVLSGAIFGLVVALLSTPALAGRVDITNGSTAQSNFGSTVDSTGPMSSGSGSFTLTLDATVYQSGPTYTYVYQTQHTSVTAMNTLTIDSGHFDSNLNWGIIDLPSLSVALQGADFIGNLSFLLSFSSVDTVSLYAQALSPQNDVQFFGINGGFSGIGLTVGPTPAQISTVPLPTSAWMGLVLVAGIGLVHIVRNRTQIV